MFFKGKEPMTDRDVESRLWVSVLLDDAENIEVDPRSTYKFRKHKTRTFSFRYRASLNRE